MAQTTKIAAIAAICTALCLPATAQDAGSYLAARQAAMQSDYDVAARYYNKAIASGPANLKLQAEAIMAYIGRGDIEAAERVAKRLADAGMSNQVTELVLNTTALKTEDYDRVASLSPVEDSLAQLLDGLLKGWAIFGQGKMSDAVAAFAEVAATEDFASFAYYHEALALALVGDFEAADSILSGENYGPLTLSPRGIEAHAQVLIQLDRREDALALIDATQQQRFSAELLALKDLIQSDAEIAFDFVTSPQEGAAEVLYNMALIVNGRAAVESVLIYARMAQHLAPDHVATLLLTAELLEEIDQYDLATEAYAKVPLDHPSFFMAEMGRADALYADDHKEAAVEVLAALSKSHSDIVLVHAAHGDMLSRVRRDDEAVEAYTKSIEQRDTIDRSAWPIFYARGIVHERQKNMAEMEADFRKALELSPDQPDVLNYLGYALVEQQIKLDEALGMIETAVAGRPNSGYIADSLGWVYYRLGRFEDAVEPMEKAVSLLPVDPIVNDHLGDVYYKVGRYREAEFQWKRALSFDPEEAEAERIRLKLEIGLEEVLAQEAQLGTTETAKE